MVHKITLKDIGFAIAGTNKRLDFPKGYELRRFGDSGRVEVKVIRGYVESFPELEPAEIISVKRGSKADVYAALYDKNPSDFVPAAWCDLMTEVSAGVINQSGACIRWSRLDENNPYQVSIVITHPTLGAVSRPKIGIYTASHLIHHFLAMTHWLD